MLTEIDQLEAHVIVNDELDPISPSQNPAVQVSSRFMGIPLSPLPPGTERGDAQMEMRMDNICCAAHGISLLLVASFLFDAGPEGEVWEKNSGRLRTEVGRIEHVVLSHYHRDHSGGLTKAIELIRKHDQGGRNVVVDVHPDRPAYRGIPRETSYEDGIYGGRRFDETAKKWQEDTLIMEERYVMCNLKGKGLVVFTGCGHAGIVNTCRDAVKLGNDTPLYCVVGGYHLADADDAKLNATMNDLKKLEPKVLLAGHCTGWRFKCLIARELPSCLVPCFSGSKYTL
ncbi:MBL fold metallo-hydrolase [Aspergillus fijiensis CBS 313.89]|uniref:Metallo-beta-lactamase domain-containing protein n=1 Tax=Aspergillus fijiensis CBS 313.89 TaxID=1448319 RepID=A0A8G1RNA7_9EURO|nr:uncharacterized protein BO72DRAFT_478906 [Aspergillus fijiensis CBS 313.89]RAK75308.1 hypothetical protein BO72DRAFT_478906 [Aspergillus fijiensis CBS 313.89]